MYGILLSHSRILDCIRFQVAGGLENLESLFQFGIKSMNPVLDRFSPLSYSIGDYIHRVKQIIVVMKIVKENLFPMCCKKNNPTKRLTERGFAAQSGKPIKSMHRRSKPVSKVT